jgi:hypothetical protein
VHREGQEHGAPSTQQFVADLAARCPAAHDKHGTVRQVLRAPIARRVGLQHGRRNTLGQLRDARPLERPGRDDDVTGVDSRARHGQREPAVICSQPGDLCVLAHRRTRGRRVVLDDAQDLAPVREAVGVFAGVRVARQFERPVRELEAQRLPTFSPPPLADLPAVQYHVLPAALLQHSAHGQSGLTAPDDDGVVVLSHTRLPMQLRAQPSVLPRGYVGELWLPSRLVCRQPHANAGFARDRRDAIVREGESAWKHASSALEHERIAGRLGRRHRLRESPALVGYLRGFACGICAG